MEGKHSSSMKQEPSATGKPAFSRQPPSPSRAETSQITNKAQTWGQQSGTLSSSSGRERLKRHIEEVSGKVMIPDSWGQENLLTDWIDYSSFDKLLAPKGITSAREALIAEGRRACTSPHQRLRVESSC
ncbi:hypothetical protein OIU85_028518 [Salix viminalis]|uniref:Protein BIC1 n=1 Tax=Salix viminalis TaxID=40686 RepID=A0A9Q0QKL2_SALVM|nr:hypothetical protein OIU85_028518 [Salix viminalis]